MTLDILDLTWYAKSTTKRQTQISLIIYNVIRINPLKHILKSRTTKNCKYMKHCLVISHCSGLKCLFFFLYMNFFSNIYKKIKQTFSL